MHNSSQVFFLGFPAFKTLIVGPNTILEPQFRINVYNQWRTQEFFSGGGGSTNSVEDRGQRERGSGGSSPLVRGSGDSYNLVQEISFHIVKFS
jgi:hypothetical protein